MRTPPPLPLKSPHSLTITLSRGTPPGLLRSPTPSLLPISEHSQDTSLEVFEAANTPLHLFGFSCLPTSNPKPSNPPLMR